MKNPLNRRAAVAATATATVVGLLVFLLSPERPLLDQGTPNAGAEKSLKIFPESTAALSGRPGPAPVQPVAMPQAVALPAPLTNPAQRPVPGMDRIPADEKASFQAALHEARHGAWPVDTELAALPQNNGVSHFAANPGQDLTARFLTDGGMRLESGIPGKSWQGTLTLSGREEGPAWQAEGTRMERAGSSLTEWYVNRTAGFEHGFTLHQRPADTAENGPVVLRMNLSGLTAAADPAMPGDLLFQDPAAGTPVAAYRNLKVWDAAGKQLSAEMKPADGGFLIAVNDHGAAWPITVDPLIASLEQNLDAGVNFGNPRAVAIDGDVMAVAVDLPAVYVYQRAAGNWTRRAKLAPPSQAPDIWYGMAVAVRGLNVLVGSPGMSATSTMGTYLQECGGVHRYQLDSGNWTLTDTLGVGPLFPEENMVGNFGASLAFDPVDGGLLVGAPANQVFGQRATAPCAYWYNNFLNWGPARIGSQRAGFGRSVAIYNGMAAIGSGSLGGLGHVTLFENISNPFTPAVVNAGSNFEQRLALHGNLLAIGNPSGVNGGSVLIHTRTAPNTWGTAQVVTRGPLPSLSGFGYSVAMEGQTLLAGSRSGQAALYTRNAGGDWMFSGNPVPDSDSGGDQNSLTALSGSRAVVARSRHPQGVVTFVSGAVEQALPTGSGKAGDHFGLHVDLDGDVAVIGALDTDLAGAVNAGSAYIFRRAGTVWQAEARLVNNQPATDDRFGVAVGISGDFVVVGADYDDEVTFTGSPIPDSGSATIFVHRGAWMRHQKLLPYEGPSASTGRSVSIDGTTVVIGIPRANGSSGLVSTYRYLANTDRWDPRGTTVPPDNETGAQFGFSVALHGDRLAVGSPNQNLQPFVGGTRLDAGRVDLFSRGSNVAWTPAASYSRLNSTAGALLGFSVALHGNTAVIGEPCGPANWTGGVEHADKQGRAWAITHNGTAWGGLTALTDPAPAGGLHFGFAVAVDGDRILVSAPRAGNALQGAAYLFARQGTAWPYQNKLQQSPAGLTEWFGCALALSGDTALAGRFNYSPGNVLDAINQAGAACVFRLIDPATAPSLLQATPPGPDGNLTLTWPAGTGLALWKSPSLSAGSWTKIPGSESATTHSAAISASPQMFFRLSPP